MSTKIDASGSISVAISFTIYFVIGLAIARWHYTQAQMMDDVLGTILIAIFWPFCLVWWFVVPAVIILVIIAFLVALIAAARS